MYWYPHHGSLFTSASLISHTRHLNELPLCFTKRYLLIMDMKTATKGRVYVILPKDYMDGLMKHYELDHGLFVKNLNPSLNERSVQDYFETWGTITACEITVNPNPEIQNAVAYVRFSSEDEADRADSAGPHTIGSTEVQVKRVVHPKMKHTVDEVSTVPAVPS